MKSLSTKECISSGWKTFWARPWLFVQAGLLLFLVNVAINLLQTIFEMGGEQLGPAGSLLVSVAAIALATGISFLVSMGETSFFLRAHDDVSGTGIRDLWRTQPFWKYVGVSLLTALLVFLGIIALVIPGIIVALALSFAAYLVLEEGLGPIEAVKKSAALTKGSRWKLFVLSLALFGINILGLLAAVIGLFVTIPVSFLAMLHAYRTLNREDGAPVTPVLDESPVALEAAAVT